MTHSFKENGQLRVQRYNLTQSVKRLGEQRQQLQYSNKQRNQQLGKLLTEHWRCLERQAEMETLWLNCQNGIQKLLEETQAMAQMVSKSINDFHSHQQEMTKLTNDIKQVSPDFQ